MDGTAQKAVYATRRLRLEELVKAAGSPAEFAREVGRRLTNYPELVENLKSFADASYLSRALKKSDQAHRKNIGEGSARALEVLFNRPVGWMSNPQQEKEPWPFGFSRMLWDDLDQEQKREAERQFLIYLSGLHSTRRQSRKRAS